MTQKMRDYNRNIDVANFGEIFMVCYKCPKKIKLEVGERATALMDETFKDVKPNLRMDVMFRQHKTVSILDQVAKEFGLVERTE